MNVHHGIIKSLELKDSRLSRRAQEHVRKALLEQKLQDIPNWTRFLQDSMGSLDERTWTIANRLDQLIPVPKLAES